MIFIDITIDLGYNGFMQYISDFLENTTEAFSKLPVLGQLGALMGTALAATGAFIGGETLIENYKQKKDLENINNIFNHLDNNPTLILQSVEDGVKQGLSLDESKQAEQASLIFSRNPNTFIEYSNEDEVAKNHLSYTKFNENEMLCVFKSSTDTIENDADAYYPAIIGWQVSKEHPLISVPLYSGSTKDTAIRYDGKEFNLPNKNVNYKNQPKII